MVRPSPFLHILYKTKKNFSRLGRVGWKLWVLQLPNMCLIGSCSSLLWWPVLASTVVHQKWSFWNLQPVRLAGWSLLAEVNLAVDAPGRCPADHGILDGISGAVELLKQGCHSSRGSGQLWLCLTQSPELWWSSSTPRQPVPVLHHLPLRKMLLMSRWHLPHCDLQPLLPHLPLQRRVWLCHVCKCPANGSGQFLNAS